MQQLADLTLLNTRPAHQAEALNQLMRDNAVQVISCPTMQIEWLRDFSVSPDPGDYDIVIFTSVNAVQGWNRAVQDGCKLAEKAPVRILAIGKATAEAGRKLGLPIQSLSESRFDSESLLAHPSMQQLQGQKVLIVKGEGGRKLLPTTLSERHAEVFSLPVYRRAPLPFCYPQWLRFQQAEHPVLLITSYESFRNLIQQTADYSEEYRSLDSMVWDFLEVVLVFSQRIADALNESGWRRPVEVLETQSNLGVLQALKKHLDKQAAR